MLLAEPCLQGCWFTFQTDNNPLKLILNLTGSRISLRHDRLLLSEFKSEILHHSRIEHQAPDALSWLKTTGTDETLIKDEVQVLYITASISHENGEESVMYVRDYGVLNHKVVATLTEPKEDERRITAHDFIQKLQRLVFSPNVIYSQITGIDVEFWLPWVFGSYCTRRKGRT